MWIPQPWAFRLIMRRNHCGPNRDSYSKEIRTRNMRAIRSKGTSSEDLLAKLIWRAGYRYRRNDKRVFGKPDLAFHKYKVAVFCDGEFWHGKDWAKKKKKKGWFEAHRTDGKHDDRSARRGATTGGYWNEVSDLGATKYGRRSGLLPQGQRIALMTPERYASYHPNPEPGLLDPEDRAEHAAGPAGG